MADFLDKVKQGISKGVSTASVKSKELLEVTRLKSQINNIQKRRIDAIEELGNIVYTMYLKENIDELRIKDKALEIQKVDSQIRNWENEIVEVQKIARESLGLVASIGACVCGAEIYEDTKFCGGCGKKIEHAIKPTENGPLQSTDIGSSHATGVLQSQCRRAFLRHVISAAL